jgi:transposase
MDDNANLPGWLHDLLDQVRMHLLKMDESTPDKLSALESERKAIEAKIRGFTLSLGDPELSSDLRSAIQKEWEDAIARANEIDQVSREQTSRGEQIERILDPKEILERLDRLAEVLAANNPTMGNVKLSMHIDRITCHADGTVEMKCCKLGALADAIELLVESPSEREATQNDSSVDARVAGAPRRRSRLRIESDEEDPEEIRAMADFAADPNRFAGLSEDWFTIYTFDVPRRKSWAEEHAAEVGELRRSGLTEEQIARRLDKSIPTVRKSLKYARAADKSLSLLPRKIPRKRWHEEHAEEIGKLQAVGMTTSQLAAKFEVSDTTIRSAVKHFENTKCQSDSERRSA